MGKLYGDLVVPEFKLLKGDCLETLKDLPDNSIDAVLCDPPYHLQSIQKRFSSEDASPIPEHRGMYHNLSRGFMGKTWDGGDIAFRTDVWRECYRVLKPGGHLVAFGGTRTIHRITCAIEDSGFEIRDMISWLYFSGFPKSHNISISLEKKYAGMSNRGTAVKHMVGQEHYASGTTNQDMPPFIPTDPDAIKWQGWGTALKPAQEPACLARKPIEKGLSIADNVRKWGTGALNIDKSRFQYGDPCWVGPQEDPGTRAVGGWQDTLVGGKCQKDFNYQQSNLGRWPANIYQCPKPSRKEKEAGLERKALLGYRTRGPGQVVPVRK
jgi:site-specific DNA-methyltransferase (adenine-specific)